MEQKGKSETWATKQIIFKELEGGVVWTDVKAAKRLRLYPRWETTDALATALFQAASIILHINWFTLHLANYCSYVGL